MTRALYRLGRFAVERRRRVLLAWVVLAVVLTVAARSSGGEFNDDFRVPGVESQAAIDLLEARFPDAAGGRAQVVLHVEAGGLNDERRDAESADALAEDGRLASVESGPARVRAGTAREREGGVGGREGR